MFFGLGSDDTYIANTQFTGCSRKYFITYSTKLNTKRDSA